MGFDEITNFIHRLPSLWKEGSADRKAMKHSLSDLQGDIYSCILGFFGKSSRVIEKDFICADLDENGWRAREDLRKEAKSMENKGHYPPRNIG